MEFRNQDVGKARKNHYNQPEHVNNKLILFFLRFTLILMVMARGSFTLVVMIKAKIITHWINLGKLNQKDGRKGPKKRKGVK